MTGARLAGAMLAVAVVAAGVTGADAPVVVDDTAISSRITAEAKRLARGTSRTSAASFAKQMMRTQCTLLLPAARPAMWTPEALYAHCRKSVFVLVTVSARGRKTVVGWGTAFAITADTIAFNAHQISEDKVSAACIFSPGGKSYPVWEVLAADAASDCAIARVETGGQALTPLPLIDGTPVGAAISILSHPDQRFYFFSRGQIARYGRRGAATWMEVTADYALGSSGGPVLDVRGSVVGMVSTTQSVYSPAMQGQPRRLQMVVKQCTPAAAILKLIRPAGG